MQNFPGQKVFFEDPSVRDTILAKKPSSVKV